MLAIMTQATAPTRQDSDNSERWLTRREVAERLKMPMSTVNGWATKGVGPRYAIFGKHARYRLADVVAWEEAQFASAAPAESERATA